MNTSTPCRYAVPRIHAETGVDCVLRLAASDGSPVIRTGPATNVIQNDAAKGWRMIVPNPQATA